MRILVIKDTKIDYAKLEMAFTEINGIYTKVGIVPKWHVEETDLSNLLYTSYRPGPKNSLGIDQHWLKARCAEIYKRWQEEIDLVIFSVHEDNWKPGQFPKGDQIWGWNISEVMSGYGVQQCRFDKDNNANNVGTMYHEIMHSHDSTIFQYFGWWPNGMLGVTDWDDDVVHGNADAWEYIRHKENQDALAIISVPLKQAFDKRKAIFDKKVSIWQRQINLLKQAIVLLNQLIVLQTKQDVPLLDKT